MSFFVTPTRLADGLEAKNLSLLLQISPDFALAKHLVPPRFFRNEKNFGNQF
jgi:hypothetical protein